MDHDILIDEDGTVQFVYDDELAAVFDGELTVTRRASHVEPYMNGWMADMRPSGGPVLFANGEAPLKSFKMNLKTEGGAAVTVQHPPLFFGLAFGPVKTSDNIDAVPFSSRAEALAAEREWLRREKGL